MKDDFTVNGYSLDEYQKKVVLSKEKVSLVIAGAGAGKSLTIIGKIVYLVNYCHVKPEEILCISFTNDATKNLEKNILKNYHFNLDIYTFHKLSLEILKSFQIEYEIAPDNYLDEIIDKYFNIQSLKLTKILNKVLGKNYTNSELLNLKRLIKTFINLYKANNYTLNYFNTILKQIKYTLNIPKYYQNKYLLLLIINVYLNYQNELDKEKALDFNDMINKTIDIVKKYGVKKKWKYIIVDEYQDTSITKFELISSIIEKTNANFLAVGDDFQSIYRFTGCNLNIFLNYITYFPNAKIYYIVNTYRNPQELINVAGKFIMKNKKQQQKDLISNKHCQFPIKVIYTNRKKEVLKKILAKLSLKEIFVLGRNNKDLDEYLDNDYKKLDNNYYEYKEIKFRYLTVHKSKGLESDNVIIINLEDKTLGFPTKLKDEKILKYVNNTKDYYPYEEERRLFYVALTRTKNNVYLITSKQNPSIFVKEIVKNKKYVKIIKENML